jgi:hypothetical protein
MPCESSPVQTCCSSNGLGINWGTCVRLGVLALLEHAQLHFVGAPATRWTHPGLEAACKPPCYLLLPRSGGVCTHSCHLLPQDNVQCPETMVWDTATG